MGRYWDLNEIQSFWPFDREEHYNKCYDYCASNCNVDFTVEPLDPRGVRDCRLGGLPDLNQDVPYVQQMLVEVIQGSIDEFGFDGVRVDASSHVPHRFLGDLTASLTVPT